MMIPLINYGLYVTECCEWIGQMLLLGMVLEVLLVGVSEWRSQNQLNLNHVPLKDEPVIEGLSQ
jgi:hypothetical protein